MTNSLLPPPLLPVVDLFNFQHMAIGVCDTSDDEGSDGSDDHDSDSRDESSDDNQDSNASSDDDDDEDDEDDDEDDEDDDEDDEDDGSDDSDDDSEYSSDDDDEEDLSKLFSHSIFALYREGYVFSKHLQASRHTNTYAATDSAGRQVCVKICARRGITKDAYHVPIEARVLAYIDLCRTSCCQSEREAQGFRHLAKFLEYRSNDDAYVIVTMLEREDDYCHLFDASDETIGSYMQQLLLAIETLHSIGVFTRDVKMGNALYDSSKNHLVLIDFDLATFITSSGHTVVIGTEGFISPYVLAHKCDSDDDDDDTTSAAPPYSFDVDFYGAGALLGCILNECYEADATPELVQKWRECSDPPRKALHEVFMALTDAP